MITSNVYHIKYSLDILHDPKQKLFTNCCHTNVQGVCNYPVLIGQNPRLCPAHLEIQMLAMQREAILKNQKRRQLDEAKAAMAAQAMMNKKPIIATQQQQPQQQGDEYL
jgi:hypothetical protein